LGRTYVDRKTKGTLRYLKEVLPEQLHIQPTEFSTESIQTMIQAQNGESLVIIDE
jgi:hypothetical protein